MKVHKQLNWNWRRGGHENESSDCLQTTVENSLPKGKEENEMLLLDPFQEDGLCEIWNRGKEG